MEQLNSTLKNDVVKCFPSEIKWTNIVLITSILLSGVINVVVWLAATIYRRKFLRQNYVYLCVTSLLLSHLVFLALNIWDEFSSYLASSETSQSPPNKELQVLWALCQSGLIAMLFVMCGNLLALVYVLLDSAYFHHARHASKEIGNEDTAKILQTKRRKAIALIAVSWALPLALIIAAVLKWNCAARCQCSIGAVGDICPISEGCSRVWSPLYNSYIFVNVALWFLEVICLVILSVRGVRNFVSFTRSPPIREQVAYELKGSLPNLNQHDRPPSENETNSPEGINDQQTTEIAGRSYVTWFHLNPRLRLVALIVGLFIMCTFPLVVVFLIDFGGASLVTTAARVTSMLCIHVYSMLVPILLVKYMTNLKLALLKLITDLLFCFK